VSEAVPVEEPKKKNKGLSAADVKAGIVDMEVDTKY
jgi:hypothetical protein